MVHPTSHHGSDPERPLAAAADPATSALPIVQRTSGPNASVEPPLSLRAAAAAVGTSGHLLAKLVEAQYVDLSRAGLAPLVAAPWISTADRSLPIIQTAPVLAVDQGWRNFVGDAPPSVLEDEDWELAQLGDWRGAPADAMLRAGVSCVGLGGLVTGLVRIAGVDHSPQPEPGRIRFEGIWLARLERVGGDVRINPAATAAEREFALTVVGCRFQGRQGGSVCLV